MPAPMQTMTVQSTDTLSQNTLKLWLAPSQPFAFNGGQYLMLGHSEAGERKPFSIASASRTDGLIELHIRQQADNEWMTQLFALNTNDTVWVEGPNDQYAVKPDVVDTATRLIFIAGGTGFAPMKALLDEYLALNASNPIEFYWGARTLEDLYLHSQMQALAAQHDQLHYIPVLSEASSDTKEIKTGLVHQQVLANHTDFKDCCISLCGPWPMQEAAKADFIEAGLAESCFN